MKRRYLLIALGIAILVGIAGVAYAAFADRGDVKGTSISVGSADIKLLVGLAGGTTESNLADELNGPVFEDIGATWEDDYLVKLFNNSSSQVLLASTAYYETVNDPQDLRSIVNIEILSWVDANSDGVLDVGELGTSYGKKTIVKWKTEGFDLPNMDSGAVAGFVLRFSADNITDSKQGSQLVFDFGFDAEGLEE